MKYPGIPSMRCQPGIGPPTQRVLTVLTECVELLNGTRSPTIDPLPSTATLADVITKLNEVIDRLTNDGRRS